MLRQPVAEPVEAHQPSKSRWNFIYKSHYLGNYIRSSTKYSQLKIFSKCEHLFRKVELFFSIQEFLFHKENFFSQTARCSLTPMSLGSSASFRRIVPSRDTSTMESKIPSFRDAKPHESWELVPLDELCKAEAICAGTSSLRGA